MSIRAYISKFVKNPELHCKRPVRFLIQRRLKKTTHTGGLFLWSECNYRVQINQVKSMVYRFLVWGFTKKSKCFCIVNDFSSMWKLQDYKLFTRRLLNDKKLQLEVCALNWSVVLNCIKRSCPIIKTVFLRLGIFQYNNPKEVYGIRAQQKTILQAHSKSHISYSGKTQLYYNE